MSGGAKRRMRVRSTVGGQVPEFQSLVVAAGQRRSAVGRKTRPTGPLRHVGQERDRSDQIAMPGKGARMLYPVAMSQSLSVLSLLPDSAARPSGENATDGMYSACPVKVGILFPAAMSQRATVLPKPLDSAIRPSGENATEVS